jgi:hypothetical protein
MLKPEIYLFFLFRTRGDLRNALGQIPDDIFILFAEGYFQR